ncbi:MAG: hypothetical protein H6621_05160 [Halobacteriovoraceae bacterium]|nr:hypothetical protein [Halobacteriovoraceae bacterium]
MIWAFILTVYTFFEFFRRSVQLKANYHLKNLFIVVTLGVLVIQSLGLVDYWVAACLGQLCYLLLQHEKYRFIWWVGALLAAMAFLIAQGWMHFSFVFACLVLLNLHQQQKRDCLYRLEDRYYGVSTIMQAAILTFSGSVNEIDFIWWFALLGERFMLFQLFGLNFFKFSFERSKLNNTLSEAQS